MPAAATLESPGIAALAQRVEVANGKSGYGIEGGFIESTRRWRRRNAGCTRGSQFCSEVAERTNLKSNGLHFECAADGHLARPGTSCASGRRGLALSPGTGGA
jgi:hypothetical protein